MLSPGLHPGCKQLDFFARHALEWAMLDRQCKALVLAQLGVAMLPLLNSVQELLLEMVTVAKRVRHRISSSQRSTNYLFITRKMFASKQTLVHQGCRPEAPVLPTPLSVPTNTHMPRSAGQCFKEKVAVVPVKLKRRHFFFLELCRFRRQDPCETATDQARRAEL